MVRYLFVFDSKARIRGRRGNSVSIAWATAIALAIGSWSGVARAATCTWNSAVAANFATAGKWSGCGNPNNIPSSGDTAVFDGTGVGNCTITADPGLASISINSGYTGTVTQSAGVGITLTANFTQGAATFAGGNSTIKVGGSFNLSGGTFTSTSGRLEVVGAFNKTGGTFTHNSGQVMLSPSSAQTFASNSATFYNLTVNTGLAGYWKLDAGSGTTLLEGAGYGNDGTLVNGPTWVTASGNLPTLGFADQAAVVFDGVNDYATLGTTNLPALNAAKTISLWVYYASVPSSQQEFLSLIASSTTGLEIGFFDTAGTRTIRAWSRGNTSLVAAGSTPSSGWHHIAYTLSGSTNTLYVDGTATTSSTSVQSGAVTNAYLGTLAGASEFFNGRIDDVRIYTRALTASEVGALAAGNQPGTSVATLTLTGAPTVANDLVIASGNLAAGTNAISVAGNWWNYGGLFSGTGTVSFTGSATGNSIRSAGMSFGGLTVSGSGSWTLADRLSVTGGALTVSAGTLDASSYTVRAGSINASGGTFSTGSATVILDGASNTTVGVSSAAALRVEDPTETSLVGYWKFDSGQGTSSRDYSGSGNTGTLVNGATWTTSTPSSIGFDDPSALSLDGVNDYVTLGTTSLPSLTADKTISIWVNYAALPTASQDLMVLTDGSSLLQLGFLNNTGKVTAWTNSGFVVVQAASALSSGWHHVAYVRSGTTNKLYIDGGTPVTSTVSPNSGNTTTAYLGTYNGSGELFAGKLDDVRIYSAALTDTQVRALAAGRYAGTGGTATVTLDRAVTVGGSFAVDSGTVSSASYNLTAGNSDATKVAAINSGTLSAGSGTLTFKGGLTVSAQGTLNLTSTGTVAIGTGKSLIVDGTLQATDSSSIPTVQVAGGSGSYTFSVGSTSSATPTLNIDGLAVKNTDANGLNVNVDHGAVTTFSQFDNVRFSSGSASAGSVQLQIYSTALNAVFNGCTFDNGTSAYNAKLTGSGGTTTINFVAATCSVAMPCESYDVDDDNEYSGAGNGVGDTVGNMATVNWMRARSTDTAGAVEGFPTAAFDWNTFTYYSTYVAFRDASGTTDRIYVRDHAGTPQYSWDLPTGNGDILGTPRWLTIGSTHYLFVGTTTGRVYRLIDDTTAHTLSLDTVSWAANGNPFVSGGTNTTPLALDNTNIYWGGTLSGNNKVFTLAMSNGALVSALTVTNSVSAAVPAATTLSGAPYLFLGQTGHVFKIDVGTQTNTLDNSSPVGSVNGRIGVVNSKVYAADSGGTLWAIDPVSMTNSWSFHDNTNHAGCTSGSCAINSSVYVDPASNRAYYGDADGHLYAVYNSSGTGTAVAGFSSYRPGGAGEVFNAAPLFTHGMIVIGGSSGNVYIIDQDAGSGAPSVYKVYKLGSAAISSVSYDAGSGSNGAYYQVATNDGKLYYLDGISDPTPGSP